MVTTSEERPFLIGIDLDGVTCMWQDGWADAYQEWYGEHIYPSERETLTACTDNTKFDSMDELYAWLNSIPDFWLRLKPQPGALGAIRDMLLDGFTFCVVTSRPNVATVQMQTRLWIDSHWPRITTSSLWESHGETPDILWYPSGHKQEAPMDLFIDDDPRTIHAIAESGKWVARFSQPWNKGVKGDRIHPVNNWSEFHRFAQDARTVMSPGWS